MQLEKAVLLCTCTFQHTHCLSFPFFLLSEETYCRSSMTVMSFIFCSPVKNTLQYQIIAHIWSVTVLCFFYVLAISNFGSVCHSSNRDAMFIWSFSFYNTHCKPTYDLLIFISTTLDVKKWNFSYGTWGHWERGTKSGLWVRLLLAIASS